MNFIDLFCGAGGLSVGLEKAGLDCLLGIDHISSAIQTFQINHPKAKSICGDISEIDSSNIKKIINNKKVDLICGGPPCQGFSTIGTNDKNDHRNHLFNEFVRIVKDLKPGFILIENVTGLLSKKNESTLISIFNAFEELGYSLSIRILSAHNYGVPQKRRRAIMIGNKFNIENKYPEIQYDEDNKHDLNTKKPHTLSWAFKHLINKNSKNNEISTAQIKNEIERKRISYIPQGKFVRYEKNQLQYLPKELWFEVEWDKITENRFRQAKLQRLDLKQCSPTITTSRTSYYHPKENRYFTPREAAAIQSFPPEFEFTGSITQQWTQIGNAVPPILAQSIGESLLKMNANRTKKVKKINISIGEIRKTAFNYKYDISQVSSEQLEIEL